MGETTTNLYAFLKLLSENKEMAIKVEYFAAQNNVEGLINYAKEMGYEFDQNDLDEYQRKVTDIFKAKTVRPLQEPHLQKQKGIEELRKFIILSETDKDVAAQLEKIGVDNMPEFIAYAKEKGFEFTAEDMNLFVKEIMKQSDELSDEELELAAGGVTMSVVFFVFLIASMGTASVIFAAVGVGAAALVTAAATAVASK